MIGEAVSPGTVSFQFERWPQLRATIQSNPALLRAREALAGLEMFHFPIAFPEVFLRRRPGFDVILGNPPWQEVTVEAHAFWARHFPGLRGLPAREREVRQAALPRERPDLAALLTQEVAVTARERAVLGAGSYPGMGTGDADLYKAFTWRFWQLASEKQGRIGVVLPRSALSALGSKELRQTLFERSRSVEIVTLVNRGNWVFPQVHPQYTFALLTVTRGISSGRTVSLLGPFASLAAFQTGHAQIAQRFTKDEVLSWTSSASLPLLPTSESFSAFMQLRRSPRLDQNVKGSWRARPNRELDATNDKPLMQFSPASTDGLWPVMKGESFDRWQPDRGADSYYAWANPKTVADHLQRKRLKSGQRVGKDSAHAEFAIERLRDSKTLPCYQSRIAFRDVTNRTNVRTVITALLPPSIFVANQAPYFLWPHGDERDTAYLLGILSSVALDWYARRFVELHVNFFVINPFPIPRPSRASPLWRRTVALAGRLAAPDARFADWARAVGVKHGPLAPGLKQDMIEELDAVVAQLYGLDQPQLAHVFDTFHEWTTDAEIAAWAGRRDRTLAYFEAPTRKAA